MGLVAVRGFVIQHPVTHQDLIGADHQPVRILPGDSKRLLFGKRRRGQRTVFIVGPQRAFHGRFVDMGWEDVTIYAGASQ